MDSLGEGPKGKKYPPGMSDVVRKAVRAIDLSNVLLKVSSAQKWNKGKSSKAEKAYREALGDFALAFDGDGSVSAVEHKATFIWQEHCREGKKYAEDILSIVKALLSFHGKSLDEKFPGPDL